MLNTRAVPDVPEVTPATARGQRENIAFNTYTSRVTEAFTTFREESAQAWSRCRTARAVAEDEFIRALTALHAEPAGKKASQ